MKFDEWNADNILVNCDEIRSFINSKQKQMERLLKNTFLYYGEYASSIVEILSLCSWIIIKI